MSNAKLIIIEAGKEPQEFAILGSVTTFGRTKDNSVSFPSDNNVSRFHAQIEQKGENFWITDFDSSNGTWVNNKIISGATLLFDRDKISFGGENSSVIFKNEEFAESFVNEEQEDLSSSDRAEQNNVAENSTTENKKSNTGLMLTAAGVLSGLAIITVIGALVVTQTTALDNSCTPEVSILSPESGITISEPTEIKVAVKNSKCLERISYLIDGEEVESVETEPYSITLEPEKFEQFQTDAGSHILTVAVTDLKGERKLQTDELNLAFEAKKKEDNSNNNSPGNDSGGDLPVEKKSQPITIAETKTLSEQFLAQFPGAYKLDTAFLIEVNKKTAEYKSEGFSNRAAPFRDAINGAFVQEQGLNASLGYILAMSRSKFENKKNGDAEGLWQMTDEFARSNGYNGQCGAETLSDNQQVCAARAAAIYSKALIINLFQGDVIYAVSCFGMSPSDAGQFQLSLPADRMDFWNVIKSAKQKEMLVRFFAAGIVAENPQKFGLKQDKPLSNLYKNLIVPK